MNTTMTQVSTTDSDPTISFAVELIDTIILGITTFGGARWYGEVQQIRAHHPEIGALIQDASVATWRALSPRERRELDRRARVARPRRRLGRTHF